MTRREVTNAMASSPMFFLLLSFLLSVIHAESSVPRYNTTAGPLAGRLNVHLVPHTHDDVGWLKTVDQYFIGSNNSIQVASVQYILDTVMEKLLENPDRKFIYVEQAFFQRWWRQQDFRKQGLVRQLIRRGQLEFINGGWCMHDEATTHYIDMIDQTTLGHRYLKDIFGVIPRVAWQLDPFGHSAVQGYLLSAEAGFDAVFFARADYQDIAKRRIDRSMEFIWRGSKSLGSTAEVFGGAMHHHYDPPEGFRYDIKDPDPPIQDDPFMYDVNVKERVDAFVEASLSQAEQFRTNHVMWAMGEDFAYSNAQTWFKNMDKLIHYVNADGRVNAFYSTPSLYVNSKHEANETWPIKTGDFFPYANDVHNFWTGYFTSRPTFKGYVRSSSAFLQTVRQLEVFIGRKKHGLTTDSLEEAMAIVQHHDAVSGTERQHVSNDYAKRLHIGEMEAQHIFVRALESLTVNLSQTPSEILDTEILRPESRNMREVEKEKASAAHESFLKLKRCPLLNISHCPPSQVDLSSGKTLVVVIYNPLAWNRKEIVSFPVLNKAVSVKDGNGVSIPSQVTSVGHLSTSQRLFYTEAYEGTKASHKQPAPYNLYFEVDVPPLGISTYFVSSSQPNLQGTAVAGKEENLLNNDMEMVTIGGYKRGIKLTFSKTTGLLTDMDSGDNNKIEQGLLWYNGSNGIEAGPQASGAYIFRPNSSNPYPLWSTDSPVTLKVVRGPLVEEVRQKFSSWASQVVRTFPGKTHAEVQYSIGPIPIDDDFGKEVISRFNTTISSGRIFYTDSNGRDYLKRVVDTREDWELNVTDPVAGNYYPVNAGIYLTDGTKDFSILVDRSIGAASLRDGHVELMLHRRLLYDDHKGVGEALNETVCVKKPPHCQGLTVTGKYYVQLAPSQEAARWRRQLTQRVLMPLQLAFTEEEADVGSGWKDKHSIRFSASEGFELPPNVVIITLQELDNKRVLLRLAHIFEIGEDTELSTIATVDLKKLFAQFEIIEVVEMSLTANQKKESMSPLQWNVEGEDITRKGEIEKESLLRGKPHKEGVSVVELGPMEIRTYSLALSPK